MAATSTYEGTTAYMPFYVITFTASRDCYISPPEIFDDRPPNPTPRGPLLPHDKTPRWFPKESPGRHRQIRHLQGPTIHGGCR